MYSTLSSKLKTGLGLGLAPARAQAPVRGFLRGKRCAVLLCAALALAGCAARGPVGLRLNDLLSSDYARMQRKIPYDTFAQIQMALFRHQRLCGGDVTFTADPTHSSYALVTEKDFPGAGWDHTLTIQLVLLLDHPIQATAYSYYAGTERRFDRMFDAIIKPDVCDGKPAAKQASGAKH
ncbi:hypothetical protein CEY11_19860 [Candidimonas nitroreducens]|uniref:Uncharacterized protein n=2 Tax=Candidimonas nitroreducens TaxID=683354 RepID=A0A225M6F0_9BURK|nr:hypothetical protein CEY11_19860 [Candidimonas nitroreducens]